VNAGHGLDYINIRSVTAIEAIDEVSIGHAIITRAILVGLDAAVREMARLVKGK
jgi:pyridoxine 5-phosphate synthase